MPKLDYYRRKHKTTIGQIHKAQSDMVMEATWDTDIASRIGWFYDQDNDDQFNQEYNINSEKSKTKIPVEIKFFEMEYNSLAKDEVSQHIMFKPSYQPNIPYYDDKFAKPLHAEFPIGLYCDIADSRGVYQRWLVVGQYREHTNQFPSYLVLPCNHKLQWIYKGKKFESWCVLRSQNSYNSGLWTDYRITSQENQKIVWLPFNDKTKTIFYDQRIAISQERETPVAWSCSKVEDMTVKGIARYTFKQDKWDQHRDYIEYDNDNNVVGIWCDWFDNGIIPSDNDATPSVIHSTITYSGIKPEIKIGGSYKKFTVTFYNNDEQVNHHNGIWKFTIDESDVSDLLEVKYFGDSTDLLENQCKIKFIGGDKYIGKTIVAAYESIDGITSNVEMNLIGL